MPQRFVKIRWVKQWPDLRVVWVNISKLDAAWQLDGVYYVPAGAPKSRHRYDKFAGWIATRPSKVMMPMVTALEDGRVSFTDGRHRFAWFRDHGAKFMPVGTGPCAVAALAKLCGTKSRICRLPLPIRPRYLP